MYPEELSKYLGNTASDAVRNTHVPFEEHPSYPVWQDVLHKIALEKNPDALPPVRGNCRIYAVALAENGYDAERIAAMFALLFPV